MSFNLEVGKRIKNARLVAGLSLKELGEKIELSEGNVQRYEAGKIKGVDVNILKKIASALNCTEAYLMGWEDEEPQEPQKQDDPLMVVAAHHSDYDFSERQLKQIDSFINFVKQQEESE